ncbi:Uncharacterised protein [Escherichia coli]|uniref:Uncharacterized protein n=1 Tax=Escherichia coli TaxID=562 RepID=A0A377CCV5_ECOLX|nr:Uncharacterised protein [Escherichia coli]
MRALYSTLPERVGFTFVGVKKDARTTVQLGNDNTLSTVDNKGTVVCHEPEISPM